MIDFGLGLVIGALVGLVFAGISIGQVVASTVKELRKSDFFSGRLN